MTDSSSSTHPGGCLCGAVRFVAVGPLRPVVNCHCGQCRRIHGAFGAYSAADSVRFERQDGLQWYESSPGIRRGFCGNCGAPLFWDKLDRPSPFSIVAGALDQPTGLQTVRHIFVADKGDFYDLTDGLPQDQ